MNSQAPERPESYSACQYLPGHDIERLDALIELADKGLCPHVRAIGGKIGLGIRTVAHFVSTCRIPSCCAQLEGDKLHIIAGDFRRGRGREGSTVEMTVEVTSHQPSLMKLVDQLNAVTTYTGKTIVTPLYPKAKGSTGIGIVRIQTDARELEASYAPVSVSVTYRKDNLIKGKHRGTMSMLVSKRPAPVANATKYNVAVFMALDEEFRVFKEVFGEPSSIESDPDIAMHYAHYEIRTKVDYTPVKLVCICASEMGITRATGLSAVLMQKFHPDCFITLGIAGSMSDDLKIGDVFLPKQVCEYLANATPSSDSEKFITSGNPLPADTGLLDSCRALIRDPNWLSRAIPARTVGEHESSLEESASKSARRTEIMNDLFTVISGDKKLASGPLVLKNAAFTEWLLKRDRQFAAADMESAGVFDAVEFQRKHIRRLAIRGISDFADERKTEIQLEYGDVFRKLAMTNATNFFRALLEAGIFS